MAEVSIILPVYNVGRYLRQCLNSIVNQSFKDIEIIIINDCSTDNSLQIINEYQKKDDRIFLINLKKNSGVSNARNEGIKIATGKYIAFIDSDDWIKQDFIEILFNGIEKGKYDVFAGTFSIYDDIKSVFYNYKHPKYIKNYKKYKNLLLIPNYTCMTWYKIYNKNFLLKNNLFFDPDLKIKEDCLFFYNLILSKPRIKFDNIPVYVYRIGRKNSLTDSQYFIMHNIITLLKKIKLLLLKKDDYKEYFKFFYMYAFLHTAYGLTCCKFSKKRTKYVLLIIKNSLFADIKNKLSISDKLVICIFKFFLNHALFYKMTALFLKEVKRLFLSRNF